MIVDIGGYDLEDKSIGLNIGFSDFYCYIDDKQFYEYKVKEYSPVMSGGTSTYFVIDLPDKINKKVLTIKIVPRMRYAYNYGLQSIGLGYRSSFF